MVALGFCGRVVMFSLCSGMFLWCIMAALVFPSLFQTHVGAQSRGRVSVGCAR